jgi:hypothetical protein
MTERTLPTWFIVIAHGLPLGLMFYFLAVTFLDPQLMAAHLVKDNVDLGGLAENLTWIILVPGIIAGLYAFIKNRSNMKPWWTAYWLLAWVLACIYFAGEEVSWGQWYFGWATPESIAQLNDQNETNFHNTSTWFDQKPRTLVEIWIFVTGFIFPIIGFFQKRDLSSAWSGWVHPSKHLFSAALFFTVVRFASWLSDGQFGILMGSSELREMCVAFFLALFLSEYPVKTNHQFK